ncbi:MAG: sensor domain-containing diguanylate cyclase [Myxococcales bacterium]|nr:sensor domain-containing diguanylate cyclase [Myxococcales bacterium]
MSTLVHAALTLRRTARGSFVLVALGLFALLDLLGVFRVSAGALRPEHWVAMAAWAIVFAHRLAARFEDEESPRSVDLHLGLLLLVAVHAAVQLGGGLIGELYPLVYILVAFLASFARAPMGTLLVMAAIGFEAALYFITEEHTDARPFALHAAFVTLFGLLNLLFTRAEIARVRERSKRELDEDKEKAREESRMFRLVSAPSETGTRDDERLFQSSLEEVQHQVYHVLHLLQRTLELHTCVLLLADDAGQLRIAELVTHGEEVAEGPFGAGEGAVGAVAKRGLVMNLENLRPGYEGLCYYRGPAPVRVFLGVPVYENDRVIGAVCADRLEARPFTAKEEEVLQGAVQQVLRAMQNERLFIQLERTKREQGILHRASSALGSALDADAAITSILEAAAQIAPFDFAAITDYDSAKKRHRVKRSVGLRADEFEGLSFADNNSLTAMVVKNRHYLPYRGEFDPRQQIVFTRRQNIRGMGSLLVLPLVVREDSLGTIAFATERVGAFPEAIRAPLQVLANQLAVSLANAAAVRRLEEMATTDGLTGCLNKRAFLDEFDRRLRSAERFGRRLSLIVTDIDHFKNVNDTYGHATGDVVIKELGAVLNRVKRETDIVARFGGEEFCILCEETDLEGAILLAERVREELAETVFQTELGKLQVQASLGVATFPDHARSTQDLFEITDKALYAAKHGGRNQVCTA